MAAAAAAGALSVAASAATAVVSVAMEEEGLRDVPHSLRNPCPGRRWRKWRLHRRHRTRHRCCGGSYSSKHLPSVALKVWAAAARVGGREGGRVGGRAGALRGWMEVAERALVVAAVKAAVATDAGGGRGRWQWWGRGW